MAFAATNINRTPLGNGHSVITGQWTGATGDAEGTLTVQAGKIYQAQFWSNASGAWVLAPISFAAGSATGTQTVTVENVAAVTDGYFSLLVRG